MCGSISYKPCFFLEHFQWLYLKMFCLASKRTHFTLVKVGRNRWLEYLLFQHFVYFSTWTLSGGDIASEGVETNWWGDTKSYSFYLKYVNTCTVYLRYSNYMRRVRYDGSPLESNNKFPHKVIYACSCHFFSLLPFAAKPPERLVIIP